MADLFEEKAKDWDGNDMVLQLSRGIGSAILDNVDFQSDMQVMDFGAGTGLITSHVLPHVKHIVAVDISAAMLDKLMAKSDFHGKVETVCQDITREPLAQTFDVIVSAMAMHHVEDTDHLVKTLASHLKPGGKVALADLDSEDGHFHPEDVEGVFHHGFDREQLQQVLQKHGFANIRFVTAHTVEKEGRQYPVFLVTAEKH